jgi:hypothetical protein
LGDLLGGPGATDPDEETETDEQLINVGGKGEDLRAFQTLHDPNNTSALAPGEANALCESVAGSTSQGSSATNSTGALQLFVAAAVAFQAANNSLTQNQTLQDTQADPFDPNYNQVFSPVFNPVPVLPALPASAPASEGAMVQSDATTLLTDEGKVSSYAQAVYVTQNRLLSCYQVEDLSSADIQNTVLNQYVAALAASETAQGQAQTAFANDLANDGAVLPITAANVTAFQSQLKSQGLAALPAQEQAAIKSYFPNPADQQAIVNGLIQVDPASVPSSFASALQSEGTNSMAIGGTLTIPPLTDFTVPPLNFAISDLTTGQTSGANGTPLSGGETAFTDITPDSLAVTATIPNVFIHTGTGNDILSATMGGNNVLDDDGGTVNFEIGSSGSGTDTFFLDTRQNPVSWNTIANFHAGDAAIVYGVGPQDFQTLAVDGLGVPNYQGLTLRTFQGGGAAFVTLTGYSTADLASGRLATAVGTAPDGSSFLLVQAT